MTSNANVASVKCLNCHGIVTHDPRRIIGCNCDPDAPQWVYINRDGDVKGWSLAQWERLDGPA